VKRRLFKLMLFLLLGAIVNVAVAWGCALWVSPRYEDEQRLADQRNAGSIRPFRRSEVRRVDRVGATLIVSRRYRNSDEWPETDDAPSLLMPDWANLPLEPHFALHSILEILVFDARGWPLISLWYKREVLDSRDQLTAVEGGIKTGLPKFQHGSILGGHRPVLPLRPIWRNFAANTVFYALVLWLPLAPFALRRVVRRKRGHCIKCGYDLRGAEHEVCPECGLGREAAEAVQRN